MGQSEEALQLIEDSLAIDKFNFCLLYTSPEKVKLALQVGQPEGGQKFVEKEFQITLQEGREARI